MDTSKQDAIRLALERWATTSPSPSTASSSWASRRLRRRRAALGRRDHRVDRRRAHRRRRRRQPASWTPRRRATPSGPRRRAARAGSRSATVDVELGQRPRRPRPRPHRRQPPAPQPALRVPVRDRHRLGQRRRSLGRVWRSPSRVIDVLTPGELTGGLQVAVTGTIDGDGNVGPVGGVRAEDRRGHRRRLRRVPRAQRTRPTRPASGPGMPSRSSQSIPWRMPSTRLRPSVGVGSGPPPGPDDTLADAVEPPMTTEAAQLQFAAEFTLFIAAVAAHRRHGPAAPSCSSSGSRPAACFLVGAGALAVAAFLHGSLLVDDAADPVLVVAARHRHASAWPWRWSRWDGVPTARLAAIAGLLVLAARRGARWRPSSSASPTRTRGGVGALFFAIALVVASRRAIAARVATVGGRRRPAGHHRAVHRLCRS